MFRPVALMVLTIATVSPAAALDMPARRPGLWEIKMEFAGHQMPAQAMKQCIDAASDKLMNSNFGGAAESACSKQEVSRSGNTMTIDAVCNMGGVATTTHSVVTGSFDSNYTVEVTSKHSGGPAIPGLPANGENRMKITATWLGPCTSGQRPGDMIMANGMTMNVLEMTQRGASKMPRR